MLKSETLSKYDSSAQSSSSSSSYTPPIFILCDICYWCATYFDKTRIPVDNICPRCNANNNELTSFPIVSNESFTFDYNIKRGVELEFKPRRKN
jgi:hypothetical protein